MASLVRSLSTSASPGLRTPNKRAPSNALRPLLGYSTFGSYRLLFSDCIKIKERFLLLTKSLIGLRPLA
jgi:hypothetical protein